MTPSAQIVAEAYEQWRRVALLCDPQLDAPSWDELPAVTRGHWMARSAFVIEMLRASLPILTSGPPAPAAPGTLTTGATGGPTDTMPARGPEEVGTDGSRGAGALPAGSFGSREREESSADVGLRMDPNMAALERALLDLSNLREMLHIATLRVVAAVAPSQSMPPDDAEARVFGALNVSETRARTIAECARALRREADLRHDNGQREAATWLHSAARVVESLEARP